jgi:hypothetical protein
VDPRASQDTAVKRETPYSAGNRNSVNGQAAVAVTLWTLLSGCARYEFGPGQRIS